MIPGLNQLQLCSTTKPLEVVLPATIKADALNTIVQYLYTGILHLNPQNAPWVEQVVYLLGLVKLYPYCRQYHCYLRRKKMVIPTCELFQNPLIVHCESEKVTQVYYLESEKQVACLQSQLSMLPVPPSMKIQTIVKQEALDATDASAPPSNSSSELALNHSEFTLGTFAESSSKERLHFQICNHQKAHKEGEKISTETVNPLQRHAVTEISEFSTITAPETSRLIELFSANQEKDNANNETIAESINQNESQNQTGYMEQHVIEQQIKLEPVSDEEMETDIGNTLHHQDLQVGKGGGPLTVSSFISNIVDRCMDEEILSKKLNVSIMQQRGKLSGLMQHWQDSKKSSKVVNLSKGNEASVYRCSKTQTRTAGINCTRTAEFHL